MIHTIEKTTFLIVYSSLFELVSTAGAKKRRQNSDIKGELLFGSNALFVKKVKKGPK